MERVLVIDDEEDILNLVKDILTSEGFEVKISPSAEYGITLVEKFKPDIILLDLMMPDMDGWEFLRIMKGNAEFSRIPVVLLTCRGEIRDKVLGIESGATDYITKPFSPDGLVKRIKTVLEESKNGKI